MNPRDPKQLISVDCPHCGSVFWAPRSQKGGYGTCTECNKAVEIRGGPEAAFWVLIVGIAGFIAAVSAVLWFAVGPTAGIAAAVIGSVALGLGILAS